MRYRFIGLALTLIMTTTAHAGAWVQPQGHGLFIAQASYYSTDSFFDSNGDKKAQRLFRKYELKPYMEYGVLNWLTVGGSAYAQSVAQSGATNYGIADPELFARARLYQDNKQVISIQPLAKFSSRFYDERPPRGGSKSTDMELSVLYGRNLNLISATDYADMRIGYRIRNRSLSPQWRADMALGLSISDSIQIVPALRSVISTAPKDSAVFSEGGDLDYSVLKAEVTGIYHMNDNQWLQAGIFSHVTGVQTGQGYGFSLGMAQRF